MLNRRNFLKLAGTIGAGMFLDIHSSDIDVTNSMGVQYHKGKKGGALGADFKSKAGLPVLLLHTGNPCLSCAYSREQGTPQIHDLWKRGCRGT